MRTKSQHGTATVEVALMVPWILFLFVGILDFGFYSYAAIATQNAARAAAIRAANSQYSFDVTLACVAALGELNTQPNMIGVTTCANSPGAVSNSQPVALTLTKLCAASSTDPSCNASSCADCTIAGNEDAQSVRAQVTYRSIPMVPIPGILMGQLQLTRLGEARILLR